MKIRCYMLHLVFITVLTMVISISKSTAQTLLLICAGLKNGEDLVVVSSFL